METALHRANEAAAPVLGEHACSRMRVTVEDQASLWSVREPTDPAIPDATRLWLCAEASTTRWTEDARLRRIADDQEPETLAYRRHGARLRAVR